MPAPHPCARVPAGRGSARPAACAIVPPYLLQGLARQTADQELAGHARRTLDSHPALVQPAAARGPLHTGPGAPPAELPPGAAPHRRVATAENGTVLPGTPVRAEGDPASGDPAVDEAYDGMGATWDLYAGAYGRDSVDGQGHPLDATVHYDRDYDNAFWNGERLVFGDGDGTIFIRFTRDVTVVGHELSHGVVQYGAGLTYAGQAGSLNESICDVFGALTEQRSRGLTADRAEWLIGAGVLAPGVQGKALRSMAAPGTAYDDPRIGKDPQPATMSGYVQTSDDNGGVHVNSGIPNHAFYLVATRLGGEAWDRAGRIWYAALTEGALPSDADFATFAAATVAAATRLYGAGSAEETAVRDGWAGVEVTPTAVPGP